MSRRTKPYIKGETGGNSFLLCLHFHCIRAQYVSMLHEEKSDEFIKNKSKFQILKTFYKYLFSLFTELNIKSDHRIFIHII